MSIKVNQPGFDHAAAIIKKGFEVEHDSHNWEAVKPTQDEQVKHLNTHSLNEYGLWFLGVDSSVDPQSKTKFVYPTGDFSVIHKSALLAAEQKAGTEKHEEIKAAARKLLEMIPSKK